MNEIPHIVEILKNSGTILYPTDTIWGLGCNAMDTVAIEKLYKIKERDPKKSMLILVESERRLQEIVEVPEMAWNIIDVSEKPVTIVYEHPKNLPKELLAEDGSIGIRLVKNEFCKRLITKLGSPLVSTSANLSGGKSPMQFSDIPQAVIDRVDYAVQDFRTEQAKYIGSSIIKVWDDNRIKVIRE